MSTPDEMTQRAFAEHIGKRPSYITELKQAGRIVMSADGRRVMVAESLERIEATKSPDKAHVAERHAQARGDEPAVEETAADASYAESRARRENFQAKLAELEYRRQAGELVELAAVQATVADICTVLRSGLETLPDVLAPQIAPVTDESIVRARLAEEVELLLGQVEHRVAEIGRP